MSRNRTRDVFARVLGHRGASLDACHLVEEGRDGPGVLVVHVELGESPGAAGGVGLGGLGWPR